MSNKEKFAYTPSPPYYAVIFTRDYEFDEKKLLTA